MQSWDAHSCSEKVVHNNELWDQVSQPCREAHTSDTVTVVEEQEARWQTSAVLLNLIYLQRDLNPHIYVLINLQHHRLPWSYQQSTSRLLPQLKPPQTGGEDLSLPHCLFHHILPVPGVIIHDSSLATGKTLHGTGSDTYSILYIQCIMGGNCTIHLKVSK